MRTLVILAAGVGSRLFPLTQDIPKALIRVAGAALLDRLIEGFAGWPERIVVVSGHKDEVLSGHFESLAANPLFRHNPLYLQTNSLFSLAVARDAWIGADEVAISNSDIILTPEAIGKIITAPGELVLGLDRRSVDQEDMKMVVSTQGIVKRVSKEVDTRSAAGEFVGVTVARGAGIATLAAAIETALHDPNLVAHGWYDLVLDSLARAGLSLESVELPPNSYVEIDTYADLEHAEKWAAG